MRYFRRKPCCFVVLVLLVLTTPLHAQRLASAAEQRVAARRFLEHRGMTGHGAEVARALAAARGEQARRTAVETKRAGLIHTRSPRAGMQVTLPADIGTNWYEVGPQQTLTAAYGAITGRVTSIAVDPSDKTGNTVYAGTTGGGVWKSTSAAGSAAQVHFAPMTDDVGVISASGIGSLSIGAVSVQPGGTGVVLAGTGDPNDALDSYFGSGILRSTDHGATWTTIAEANLDYSGAEIYSFYGEGFSGFAWSSVTPNLVVAAVTQSYEGSVVNALQTNSVQGLYYSTDAGATWSLATLTDGPGQAFQSPANTGGGSQGSAVTAVVWNPVRQAFYAAVRYHGYYASADGMTWTRLPNQPGTNLAAAAALCPQYGATSCPMFRGALAVQPVTGDMFAVTVDKNLADQGIWQDVCGGCGPASPVMFGTQIPDVALEDGNGNITQGDYDLWLAAVPVNAGTELYAGTNDIFEIALGSGLPWRNTTNVETCAAAQVAPAQHAVAVGPAPSLVYFGNDGGLWRTTDGIAQQLTACLADDAAHFDNLNGGLGSLAEVSSLAQAMGTPSTMLLGETVNGAAGTATAQGGWPQVLDGLGAFAAIDPSNAQNWYVTSGPGVSIGYCGSGAACAPESFPAAPLIGDAQTGGDGAFLGEPAVWMLDPQDATKMLVGTCRVWRGSVAGGVANWNAGNALSPPLGDALEPDCTEGEGQIQSLAGSGTISGGPGAGKEILYAGMEGTPRGGGALPYGGDVAGHVFTATVSAGQTSVAAWTDVAKPPSSVTNDEANQGQFNPGGFGVSSVVVDPHDASGQTVYATIQGFAEPTVYRSTNQGQSWTNITANLPITPVNALVVDPNDAEIVYVATDAGVYATTQVTNCAANAEQCWSPYGIGLPDAPVTTLTTQGAAGGNLLVAGTYGRGVYEMLLATAPASGNGSAPATDLLSTNALTFATQAVGTVSAAQYVTITNSGDLPLTLITASSSASDFVVDASACATNVPGHASCAMKISFAPQTPGVRSGVLTISDALHYGSTALSVALSGNGSAAAGIASLAPAALDFGSEGLPLTPPLTPAQSVTLTNNSGAAITGLALATTGDFAIASTTCGSTLGTGSACTVSITFAPTATGPRSGVLTAVGQGLGQGVTTQLSGVGLSFTMGISSAASITVVTGTLATYQLGIVPIGGSSGSIALACSSMPALPAGSTCSLNPANIQLQSGTTAYATLSVMTPALPVSSLQPGWQRMGWALAVVLPFGGCCRRRLRAWGSLLVLTMLTAGAIGLAGCGTKASGGSSGTTGSTGTTGGGGGTASSPYVLTVTAMAPGISVTSPPITLLLEQ